MKLPTADSSSLLTSSMTWLYVRSLVPPLKKEHVNSDWFIHRVVVIILCLRLWLACSKSLRVHCCLMSMISPFSLFCFLALLFVGLWTFLTFWVHWSCLTFWSLLFVLLSGFSTLSPHYFIEIFILTIMFFNFKE